MSFRVLILDQEPIVCRSLPKFLKRAGIEGICLSDPVWAIAEFVQSLSTKKPFDLMFADADMPFDQGQKTIRVIRSIESEAKKLFPCDRLRIIGTTTRPWFGTEDGEEIGFDDVLLKPCGLEWVAFVKDSIESFLAE